MFGKQYPNCVKNKNESLETYIRKGECPGCGGAMVAEGQLNEKQDACYHKVKSRYKVWPSAYASGALVQCRKKGAANWGNSNESITQEEYDQLDENLKKWFSDKWVRFGPDGKIKGDCARGDDSEGKPKCLPQSKAHSLGKKGRASAAARKRREDPNPERSGKAINVSTDKKTNEGMTEGQRVARKHGQPAGSKKHSDLYTDENPKGTITGLKFATVEDAKASVSKIRNSGRSHAHKIQAAVAMEQRARAAGKTEAAAVYRQYINANKKTENVEQGVAEAERNFPGANGPVSVTTTPGSTVVKRKSWDSGAGGSASDRIEFRDPNSKHFNSTRNSDYDSGDYSNDPDSAADWPFEALNELSNDKLTQYKHAAAADAGKSDLEGNFKRADKRFSGIVQATKKQFANDVKKYQPR